MCVCVCVCVCVHVFFFTYITLRETQIHFFQLSFDIFSQQIQQQAKPEILGLTTAVRK